MNEIVKVCPVHGDLTIEQTRKDGRYFRCKACRMDTNRKTYYKHREKRVSTSMRWKLENRGDYNEWCRQDRKNHPEKYRRYKKAHIDKKGIVNIRSAEVLRIHGLTKDDHDKMLEEQKNLCAVCVKAECRLGRDKKTVTPLCIDHCHTCREDGKKNVRGLVCHGCNQVLGHAKDSIETLKSAIAYLEKHQCK